MTAYASKDALTGRVALVTGAGSGIGLAISRAFLSAGARVALVDVDGEALAAAETSLAAGERALFLEADVSGAGEPARCLEAAEKALGPVDTLVNNAGIAGPMQQAEEVDPAGWRETLEVNLTAPFLWTAEFVRRLPAEGGEGESSAGCVINLSSTAGKRPLVNRAAYCASKAGVIGLTRALAAELGPRGIRVNAICPGAVRGERIERVLRGRAEAAGRSYEEEMARTFAETPLGGFVEPEDVAAAAVYLASAAARFVTGEDMNVNGGRVMF